MRAREHPTEERSGEKQQRDRDHRADGDETTPEGEGSDRRDHDHGGEVRQGLTSHDGGGRDRRDQREFPPAVRALTEDAARVGLDDEVHRHDEGKGKHERDEGERWLDIGGSPL